MGLKVEFSSQRFKTLLIKLSRLELLNFSTCSRREEVALHNNTKETLSSNLKLLHNEFYGNIYKKWKKYKVQHNYQL